MDIQHEAIDLVTATVERAKLSHMTPVLGDIREIPGSRLVPRGAMDVVVCNPPYKRLNSGIMSTTESDKIARHETMCSIDDVCAAAKALLRFGGRFCLCHRPERLCDVLVAMRYYNLEPKRLEFAVNKPSDEPWLVLIEGKKGSKPFMRVKISEKGT